MKVCSLLSGGNLLTLGGTCCLHCHSSVEEEEVAGSSKTRIHFCQVTWHHIPENSTLHNHYYLSRQFKPKLKYHIT